MTDKMHMMVQHGDAKANQIYQKQIYFPKFQQDFNKLQDFVSSFDQGHDKFKPLNISRAVPPASGVSP
jgi:uncharacterized protein YozE (UPF0346 family)